MSSYSFPKNTVTSDSVGFFKFYLFIFLLYVHQMELELLQDFIFEQQSASWWRCRSTTVLIWFNVFPSSSRAIIWECKKNTIMASLTHLNHWMLHYGITRVIGLNDWSDAHVCSLYTLMHMLLMIKSQISCSLIYISTRHRMMFTTWNAYATQSTLRGRRPHHQSQAHRGPYLKVTCCWVFFLKKGAPSFGRDKCIMTAHGRETKWRNAAGIHSDVWQSGRMCAISIYFVHNWNLEFVSLESCAFKQVWTIQRI